MRLPNHLSSPAEILNQAILSYQWAMLTLEVTTLLLLLDPVPLNLTNKHCELPRGVKARGAQLLRAGAYKPRTSPYSFQGLGEEGLKF